MVRNAYGEPVIGTEISFTDLLNETPTAKLTCKFVREGGSSVYPSNPTTTIDFAELPDELKAKMPEVIASIKQAIEYQMEKVYGETM